MKLKKQGVLNVLALWAFFAVIWGFVWVLSILPLWTIPALSIGVMVAIFSFLVYHDW